MPIETHTPTRTKPQHLSVTAVVHFGDHGVDRSLKLIAGRGHTVVVTERHQLLHHLLDFFRVLLTAIITPYLHISRAIQ